MTAFIQHAVGGVPNGTAATATLPVPATAGSKLLAVMGANRATGNIGIPAGFTEIYRGGVQGAGVVYATKDAAGGETSATASATLGSSRLTIVLMELDSGSMSQVSQPHIGTGTAADIPAITGAGIAVSAIVMRVQSSSVTWNAWNEAITGIVNTDLGVGSNNVATTVGYRIVEPAGDISPSKTWSPSGDFTAVTVLFDPTAGEPVEQDESGGAAAVVAVVASGDGEPVQQQSASGGATAGVVAAATGDGVAAEPFTLNATLTDNTVALTWNTQPAATGYAIERDGAMVAFDVQGSSYIDSPGNGEHTYRVGVIQ